MDFRPWFDETVVRTTQGEIKTFSRNVFLPRDSQIVGFTIDNLRCALRRGIYKGPDFTIAHLVVEDPRGYLRFMQMGTSTKVTVEYLVACILYHTVDDQNPSCYIVDIGLNSLRGIQEFMLEILPSLYGIDSPECKNVRALLEPLEE